MGQIVSGGFSVCFQSGNTSVMANVNGVAYYYLAFRPVP